MDLSLDRINAAVGSIDPVFLNSPQFVSDGLSAVLGREVVVKVETLNPIGSFKGRGTWLLAQKLDPASVWVCATAGNFGQGLAYAARRSGAQVHVFAAAGAPLAKVERIKAFGARVEISSSAESAAREYAAAEAGRLLVVDGRDPVIAEGAATIGVELDAAGAFDTIVVQIGDGALISGVAHWLKSRQPDVRAVGVCASGAPAMAESIAQGRPISVPSAGTIAAALEITHPVAESLARVSAVVDQVVLVDDDDMTDAMHVVAQHLGLLVEPAGAAGIAAITRHRDLIAGDRVAVILTGAGTP